MIETQILLDPKILINMLFIIRTVDVLVVSLESRNFALDSHDYCVQWYFYSHWIAIPLTQNNLNSDSTVLWFYWIGFRRNGPHSNETTRRWKLTKFKHTEEQQKITPCTTWLSACRRYTKSLAVVYIWRDGARSVWLTIGRVRCCVYVNTKPATHMYVRP